MLLCLVWYCVRVLGLSHLLVWVLLLWLWLLLLVFALLLAVVMALLWSWRRWWFGSRGGDAAAAVEVQDRNFRGAFETQFLQTKAPKFSQKFKRNQSSKSTLNFRAKYRPKSGAFETQFL